MGGANCTPTFQAQAWDARNGCRLTKTFSTLTAAKRWREEIAVDARRGELAPPPVSNVPWSAVMRSQWLAAHPTPSIDAAMSDWLRDARAGEIRTLGRKPYAPGSLVSIEQNYRLRIKPTFGPRAIDTVTAGEVQRWIDGLCRTGVTPATVETTYLPLRLLYRRAIKQGLTKSNPTDGIELPLRRRSRRRPPDVTRVPDLLAALEPRDRVIWGLAVYAGLRRSELLGLWWEDLELDRGVLHVERSWNPNHGYGPPKSERGYRTVPVPHRLGVLLHEHALLAGDRAGVVIGGRGRHTPPSPSMIQYRADRAWRTSNLPRTTLHACRHLYASVSAQAGVSLHSLSRFMGRLDRDDHRPLGSPPQRRRERSGPASRRVLRHA